MEEKFSTLKQSGERTMMAVKAFYEDELGRLYCAPKGDIYRHYYELNKTYVYFGKVEICKSGYHASANCDVSETALFYPPSEKTVYCLVEINVVERGYRKVVGDKITVLRKLTFDECIKYDRTGEWCYSYAVFVKGADVKKLQRAVIQKDKTGEWCYNFAKSIGNADIDKLQKAVIDKDKTGKYCYFFAIGVKGADISLLQRAVITKDKTGEWCYKYAAFVKGAGIKKLQEAIIKKNEAGEYCHLFATNVGGADIDLLTKAISTKEKAEKWLSKIHSNEKGKNNDNDKYS